MSAPAGATIHIPAGTVIKNDKGEVIESYAVDTDKKILSNGWYLSDFYMDQVQQATVKK